MQPELRVFIALLFAHILGDFLLQSGRMVEGKIALRGSAYRDHALVHLGLAIAALALFTYVSLWARSTLYALAFLTLGHVLLDLSKSSLIRWRPALDRSPLFIADQIVHVVIVAAASMIAVANVPSADALWAFWLEERDRVLIVSAILVGTVFPAGYLIRYLLGPLSNELAASGDEHARSGGAIKELTNAGLYLGWLERALLVVAFAEGSFMAVGLIVGAKSVARFPEFKSRAFAEYFLIGTLTSVAIAAVGGWILRLALAQFAA